MFQKLLNMNIEMLFYIIIHYTFYDPYTETIIRCNKQHLN